MHEAIFWSTFSRLDLTSSQPTIFVECGFPPWPLLPESMNHHGLTGPSLPMRCLAEEGTTRAREREGVWGRELSRLDWNGKDGRDSGRAGRHE